MQIIAPITYIGPNRRSEKTVIEWGLQMSSAELRSLAQEKSVYLEAIQAKVDDLGFGILPELTKCLNETDSGVADWVIVVANWVAEIALAMQQDAGHKVFFRWVLPCVESDRCRLVFEYEHLETGLGAGELALRVLAESIAGLDWESEVAFIDAGLQDAYKTFLSQAVRHLLPQDTQAIIDAAACLDIPSVKLEREPYGVMEGDFRIRKNGLLKLGHSCYQHIVDGTLCIDRNPELVPILFDREKLFQWMAQLELPIAKHLYAVPTRLWHQQKN
jgi:hypothetical protein